MYGYRNERIFFEYVYILCKSKDISVVNDMYNYGDIMMMWI